MTNATASLGATLEIHVEVRGRVISEFSYQHLRAAVTFRDHLIRVENANEGKEFGEFFSDIRSYGSACIMSSAAAIEALVNELFITPGWPLRERLPDFEAAFWGKGGIERKSPSEKYQVALQLLGLPKFDERVGIFRDLWALIELRNALVHYKPTWDPDRRRQVELKDVLSGKYEASRFVDEGADFVTMKSMSGSAMLWVTSVVFGFIRDFHRRTQFAEK